MAKKIVWSENAVRDRVNIFQFWEWHNKSATYSNRLELLFQTAANLISKFPRLGIQTDMPGVRAKLVKGLGFITEIRKMQLKSSGFGIPGRIQED